MAKIKRAPSNPLLRGAGAQRAGITVNPDQLTVPTVFDFKRKRERTLAVYFRKQSAEEAVAKFDQDTDVFGLTKGHFSLIELIEAVLGKTGPALLTLSTWTAANADLQAVLEFLETDLLTGARFLFDLTFHRRQPAIATKIRDTFGRESIRVTRNHAKFFLLDARAAGWTVSCKTSMNLNFNPRLEDFDLSNDRHLFRFLDTVVDDLFGLVTGEDRKDHHRGQVNADFSTFGGDPGGRKAPRRRRQ